MDFASYQTEAAKHIVPGTPRVQYSSYRLFADTGIVGQTLSSAIATSKGRLNEETKAKLKADLSEVLFDISTLATDLGLSLEDIAAASLTEIK